MPQIAWFGDRRQFLLLGRHVGDSLLLDSFRFFLVARHGDGFLAESRSDPGKANVVELLFPLVRQLRLFVAELERVLAALLHDPTPKGLVRRVGLRHVAVAVLVAVLHELFVAILPTNRWLGHAPLEADRFELVNAVLRQAGLGLFARWSAALSLEVSFVLVFALHLDPFTEIRALWHVAVSMNGLVFFELFKPALPACVLPYEKKVRIMARRISLGEPFDAALATYLHCLLEPRPTQNQCY